MNGKVTLTLKHETYNVLAIVPMDIKKYPHIAKYSIATIYMRKGLKGHIYTATLNQFGKFHFHIGNEGKWTDIDIAKVQAQSIPFNDAIIPPKQAEAQPPAAAPETITFKDQTELREHLGLPPAKTSMPKLTAFFEAEAARQDEQTELDAARAEITKLQTDVVTLTADNRKQKQALRRLLEATGFEPTKRHVMIGGKFWYDDSNNEYTMLYEVAQDIVHWWITEGSKSEVKS